MEGAGYDLNQMKEERATVSVYVGIQSCEYQSVLMKGSTAEGFSATGTTLSVAAGRISYVMGWTGEAMSIDRRRFLKSSAAGAAMAGLGVASCAHPGASGKDEGETPFQHGVASGDPLSDRVILWTRVSPNENRMGEPVKTRWAIARDATGRDVVASG